MRDELVIECLNEALKKESPKSGLIIHVDQGSQYTGHRFFEVIQAHKLILSPSKRQSSYDNALMESFYKTFPKRELEKMYIYQSKVTSGVIDCYLENYYNTKRIHSSLNYLTPAEYERSPN